METPGRLKLFCNPRARRPSADAPDTSWASPEALRTVRRFHQTLPGYQPTPLVALNQLARRLGVGKLWIKDESRRFGLKAFKALGASYAVCAVLAEQLGLAPPLNFAAFRQPEIHRRLSNITLLAASDGNHGLAVAWMASQLGCRSRILLPRDTAACRTRAIELMDGEAVRVDGNYDAAVDRAAREAAQPGALLIQDTGRQGDETVPLWVMQGYLTLFEETFAQMNGFLPSHVFVPCGVGSLAGSLQAYLVERYGGQRPRLIVIEAAAADCYYRSMAAGGASIIAVEGNLETRMAGLACGVPSHLGWPLLRRFADGFASCPDAIAANAMRRLAFPLPGDPPVESGECGAVTLGCLQHLLQAERGKGEQVPLELGPAARILLISTEGATNPDSYREMLGEDVDRSLLGD